MDCDIKTNTKIQHYKTKLFLLGSLKIKKIYFFKRMNKLYCFKIHEVCCIEKKICKKNQDFYGTPGNLIRLLHRSHVFLNGYKARPFNLV